MGVAISLNYDCFSILTRVLESCFSTFFRLLKIVWVDFDIEFSVGAAISLNFECFSTLTRVLESHFSTFFHFFSAFKKYIYFENRVGRLSMLNLVWERLYRSILTAFRF